MFKENVNVFQYNIFDSVFRMKVALSIVLKIQFRTNLGSFFPTKKCIKYVTYLHQKSANWALDRVLRCSINLSEIAALEWAVSAFFF